MEVDLFLLNLPRFRFDNELLRDLYPGEARSMIKFLLLDHSVKGPMDKNAPFPDMHIAGIAKEIMVVFDSLGYQYTGGVVLTLLAFGLDRMQQSFYQLQTILEAIERRDSLVTLEHFNSAFAEGLVSPKGWEALSLHLAQLKVKDPYLLADPNFLESLRRRRAHA